jgi:hypothetical protein
MAQQLSVFVQNRPGRVERVTGILAEAGINIRATALADQGDYGVIKLLVNAPQQAAELLTARGVMCSLKDVVALKLADRPGSLHDALKVLAEAGANVLDAYGCVLRAGELALFVVAVSDPAAVESALQEAGIEIVRDFASLP